MHKKFPATILAVAMLLMASCQNRKQDSVREEIATETAGESVSDEIVTASATDTLGNTLDMEFNNSAGTASFILGTDTILLRQDTMASGVRFSNERYIYTEHQGEIRLTKNGELVFEHGN